MTVDIQTFVSGNSNVSGAAQAFERGDAPGDDAGFIGREELRSRIERGEPVVVLESLPERYYRKAHLPGARSMPHDQVEALAASLVPSRSSAVVVYCASVTCRNSDQAADSLRRLGYQNVRVYREGKADWQAAGLPVEGG
ncbi:MAG TPA: rhodanese-like domain-containing protein [Polyangiaceae bacterium]|nr:rhodanese-like domain-containing protein [Polyangiaceae bacterium]